MFPGSTPYKMCCWSNDIPASHHNRLQCLVLNHALVSYTGKFCEWFDLESFLGMYDLLSHSQQFLLFLTGRLFTGCRLDYFASENKMEVVRHWIGMNIYMNLMYRVVFNTSYVISFPLIWRFILAPWVGMVIDEHHLCLQSEWGGYEPDMGLI